MREIQKLLSEYWAKSGGITIREHTDGLLKNLEIIRENYEKEIESLIPEELPKKLKERFWEILELACEYHDYGKVHAKFQQKVGNGAVKVKRDLPEVKHNLLSPVFVEHEDEVIKKLVRLLVMHHHQVDHVDVNRVSQVLKEEFGIEKNPIAFMLCKKEYEYLQENIAGEYGIDLNILERFYRLLKGLLLRIDHSSSSREFSYVEEKPYDDTLKFVENYLKGGLNKLQRHVLEKRDENLVIVAPTGAGKTEAGFIYLKRKGFFMLPYRVSANGIYERAWRVFGEKAGLLHSSALNYLLSKSEEDEVENNRIEGMFLNYFSSKNFAKPIVVCTPDQLMHFVFGYKGFEKYYATALYSRLVIDEIQSYDPITIAFLVKALSVLKESGGKFLILTATFPEFLKEEMKIEPEFVGDAKRAEHHAEIISDSILSDKSLKKIEEYSQNSKVLVVVNTVKRSLELKRALKNANLLHSRFILKHRNEREREIKDFFDGEGSGIWITTQLAEVSLDLDADYLFTELSTADSLIQRMGRCNRRGKKPTDKPNVFIFTEDCSGIGTVYYKALHENTKANLKDGLWNWEYKWELMSKVYAKDALKDTKYWERYEKAKGYIDALWNQRESLVSSKRDAQDLFRDINAVSVVPKEFEEQVRPLIDRWKNSKENFEERLRAMNEVLSYTFQLPEYYIKDKEPAELKLGIYYVRGSYDEEYGFQWEGKDPEEDRDNIL
ncbi:CRISPR-associated helicase Cas3' [Thermocrinis sp.]